MAKTKLKIPEGLNPEENELKTADFFVERGKTLQFLTPIRVSRMKTADAVMDGLVWEFKAPIKNGKHNIERLLQKASKQSCNIVVDLRNCKMKDTVAISKIKSEYTKRTSIKRIIIIKKNLESVELVR